MSVISYSVFLVTFLFIFKEINCNTSHSVIIVGAGAAGIAAAKRLLENNITDFVILEAKNRIGGRIHSVEFGDGMVDLGAQWVYGDKSNEVYELVKQFDIIQHGEPVMTLYHSSYDELDVALENEFYNIFYKLYVTTIQEPYEESLGEYITKGYNETLHNTYGNDKKKIQFGLEFLEFLKKAILMFEGAFSVYDVSAKGDFTKCESNCGINFKGAGFKIVLDILTKKYPKPEEQLPIYERISLNKEVTKIVWDTTSEFKEVPVVQCLDGTTYAADYIIFTASLGVLKFHYKTLFQPQLPQHKISAITDLGIASIFKVFLHFPIKWWPSSNFTDFSFLWAEKDKQLLWQELLDLPLEQTSSLKCCGCDSNENYLWLLDLVGVYAVPENPFVLEAIFCGESVPMIEKCSNKTVIDGIMFILNRFIGDFFDDISTPDSIARHSWYSDPHFHGAFSFQTIEGQRNVRRNSRTHSYESVLAEPVVSSFGIPTLLFAGEATHPHHYSTVNGAIESGYREANRIIHFYEMDNRK